MIENISPFGFASPVREASNPKEANAKIDGFTEDQRFFLSGARVTRTNARDEKPAPAQYRLSCTRLAARGWSAFQHECLRGVFHCKPGDEMVGTGQMQVNIW